MAQGVKCDVPDCNNFGELPVDPMGGFQPVGDWVEIKMSGGRYHACSPEHAAMVATTMGERHTQNRTDSEADAQARDAQAATTRGTVATEPNGQTV